MSYLSLILSIIKNYTQFHKVQFCDRPYVYAHVRLLFTSVEFEYIDDKKERYKNYFINKQLVSYLSLVSDRVNIRFNYGKYIVDLDPEDILSIGSDYEYLLDDMSLFVDSYRYNKYLTIQTIKRFNSLFEGIDPIETHKAQRCAESYKPSFCISCEL